MGTLIPISEYIYVCITVFLKINLGKCTQRLKNVYTLSDSFSVNKS